METIPKNTASAIKINSQLFLAFSNVENIVSISFLTIETIQC